MFTPRLLGLLAGEFGFCVTSESLGHPLTHPGLPCLRNEASAKVLKRSPNERVECEPLLVLINNGKAFMLCRKAQRSR